jgi:hypothetical protein
MNTEVHDHRAVERRRPRAVAGVAGSAASILDDAEPAPVARSAAA